MMSDETMSAMIEYLKTVCGWSDSQIVDMLAYITNSKKRKAAPKVATN